MVHFAIYGPLDSEADAPFCIRGWEPDPQGRLRLVVELYGENIEAVRTRLPAEGYARRDPTPAERRELPRLREIWTPATLEAA